MGATIRVARTPGPIVMQSDIGPGTTASQLNYKKGVIRKKVDVLSRSPFLIAIAIDCTPKDLDCKLCRLVIDLKSGGLDAGIRNTQGCIL